MGLFFIFVFIAVFGGLCFIVLSNLESEEKLDTSHINEDSFQRYAKFFGSYVPTDDEFIQKLNNIYTLIVKNKETDITVIAKKSNCTVEECVLKIKYLKNKRMLGDYYIDTTHSKIVLCDEKDQELLEKYKPYIYNSHLQIDEIANLLPNKKYLDMNSMKEEIFNELNYLDEKSLLNGLIIDDIDRKIIYYTIEKRKENKGYESIHCSNCGALNDVQIDGKGRCNYCKNIIKGSGVVSNEVE